MTIVAHADAGGAPGRDWIKRYPPLAVMAAIVGLAVFGLPSALNLPQANPGEIAEYAPVPGQSTSAQVNGNFGGLGQAEGGGLGQGESTPAPTPASSAGGGPGALAGDSGSGKQPPSQYQCVGNPPRQTEDPLAPPCVPYFFGSNGGSTYPGVTAREITVLVYLEGGQINAGCESQASPIGAYVDLNAPPQSNEGCRVRALRAWQSYFNQRYQLYGRKAHFYIYWSNDINGEQPQERTAEANDNYTTLHPFAVMPLVFGNTEAYETAMSNHHVMEFVDGAAQYFTQASFQQFAPLLWGYWPAAEEQAQIEASWFCSKVIRPGTVTFSSDFMGKPRKYAIARTSDSNAPEVRRFQDMVVSLMQGQCGFHYSDTVDYPVEGPVENYTGPKAAAWNSYAPPKMATFKQEGITTIIWPGGSDLKMSPAAKNAQYFPEWVLGGDGIGSDGNVAAAQQDQTEWAQAVVVTPGTYSGANGVPPACADAYNSVDPGQTLLNQVVACGYYPMARELFTGIQVAGPRLTPDNVAQGYRAIPPHPSSTASVPACYYPANSYTCVKDATAEHWDPNAVFNTANVNFKGCWRMIENGRRYLTGQWPAGDVKPAERPDDICNSYAGGIDVQSVDTNPG